MKAIKKVLTTVFFAALSPLYLLYIFALVVLAPFGLALAKPFRRAESTHHFSEYADRSLNYSLDEMFTISGFKRVAMTLIFALLSPLYIPYMIIMVLIASVGSLVSRISKA
ncbi:hypothetical protein SDC9_161587 [bioreactor metagenome]|uniref:Uncharacterized protein n=1 Tax=bioreactor metagenome TaxID=1076179 RepID=A0A645FIM9_9ZZZZ